MKRITAIPTTYAGSRFRSRTEARWAVFFTQLGWRWEYEPEGFQLPSGRYLPDFLLYHPSGRRWFEVKPFEGTAPTDARWVDLARGSKLPVLVAYGLHRPGDGCEAAWTRSGRLTRHAGRAVLPTGRSVTLGPFWQEPRHTPAWNAANSARFEHGESGPPQPRRRR